jgi:hypothetical protein
MIITICLVLITITLVFGAESTRALLVTLLILGLSGLVIVVGLGLVVLITGLIVGLFDAIPDYIWTSLGHLVFICWLIWVVIVYLNMRQPWGITREQNDGQIVAVLVTFVLLGVGVFFWLKFVA